MSTTAIKINVGLSIITILLALPPCELGANELP
jgi:hypothetical protein